MDIARMRSRPLPILSEDLRYEGWRKALDDASKFRMVRERLDNFVVRPTYKVQ